MRQRARSAGLRQTMAGMHTQRLRRFAASLLSASLALSGCAPSLNWRELSPQGSDMVASFPCKPDQGERDGMGLAHCEAAGLIFSLSWAEAGEPARVDPALAEMPRAVAAKLGLSLPKRIAFQVPGMTPMQAAGQYRFEGGPGVIRLAVFSHGTRVYQAMLRSSRDDRPAWDAFIAGLRFAGAGIAGVPR